MLAFESLAISSYSAVNDWEYCLCFLSSTQYAQSSCYARGLFCASEVNAFSISLKSFEKHWVFAHWLLKLVPKLFSLHILKKKNSKGYVSLFSSKPTISRSSILCSWKEEERGGSTGILLPVRKRSAGFFVLFVRAGCFPNCTAVGKHVPLGALSDSYRPFRSASHADP